MDLDLKQRFLSAWTERFGNADLPVGLWYSDAPAVPAAAPKEGWSCFIADLRRAVDGVSISVDVDGVGCFGGKRFLGFTQKIAPNMDYFLSCGIPGVLEGERYKSSPEVARAAVERQAPYQAEGRYLNLRRWDLLTDKDEPEVIVFLARGDVLSGLFTLANFDRVDPYGVIAPFSSGCGSVVTFPFQERAEAQPRAVLGMFDPSARPHVEPDRFSFAVPMKRFVTMVDSMPESFLIAPAWGKLRPRLD